MSRKKISTTVYITPDQDARLKTLHERTKVPTAEYIRQGIEMVLAKHGMRPDFMAAAERDGRFDLSEMLPSRARKTA